ncbi:anti-sigma factor [Novosphingobium taihuense]|uniref:Anti-sigma factor RsiW n=1 Tax=Novosphingobium taihuense TaxID=260085 RepID=A0A7W7ABY3_9SPHN|nr:anti-sigma factor [Novosphingobium taihuense]MBB4613455.1 hypothetical protein [Novosphingobium taihuense]TWH80960.1 hypothetical protein IQ25_03696 [Novosphingobium taihuense]
MTRPTPEQIAAFADGQLEGAEHADVAAAIAADDALTAQVAAHQALRARLSSHFAPVTSEAVPDRLVALLSAPQTDVVDLAQVRARRRGLPRWTWIAGPALAASLVLAVTLGRGGGTGADYAPDQIAAALDSQLVGEQPGDAPVRVLLSFRDAAGAYCRAYSASATSGIACRDGEGWKLQGAASPGAGRANGEYRQAGSEAEIMAQAQALAAGPALDAEAEKAARARGWRGPSD